MKVRKVENIETGKRIHSIRESKKMTLADVALLLGYKSPKTVFSWEKGELPVPEKRRMDLADALDCTVSDIFTEQKTQQSVKAKAKAKVKIPVNSTMDGQIWELNSPAGRMQMLVLAESRDVVTGLLLSDDNDGNKTYPICGKWVDVTAISSKPKSYLFNKVNDADTESVSKVKDLICDYLKIEPKVVVQERVVREDTTALEKQILELKAKLYDMMTA